MKTSTLAAWVVLGALCAATSGSFAQDAKGAKADKAEAPELMDTPYVLDERVVTEQWPATPAVASLPTGLSVVNPGQCVRVAVAVLGKEAAGFLPDARIGFTVDANHHSTVLDEAAVAEVKPLKSTGAHLMQRALTKGGLTFQIPATAAMYASAGRWCVAADAPEGKAVVKVSLTSGGKKRALSPVTLTVLAPEKSAGKPLGAEKLSEWSTTFYREPDMRRLVEVAALAFENESATNVLQQFFVSAARANPAAAARLGPQVKAAAAPVQALAVKLLGEAGVTLLDPPALSPMQMEFVRKMPDVPDAYALDADGALFGKQDQLWAMFTATGSRKPIEALVSMLAWRKDYEAFAAMQKKGKIEGGLTPTIARGLTFMSAGWSLASFDDTDPLAADYLLVIRADPKTPADVRRELERLHEDAAFKHQ